MLPAANVADPVHSDISAFKNFVCDTHRCVSAKLMTVWLPTFLHIVAPCAPVVTVDDRVVEALEVGVELAVVLCVDVNVTCNVEEADDVWLEVAEALADVEADADAEVVAVVDTVELAVIEADDVCVDV